jgi:hypothetical protein
MEIVKVATAPVAGTNEQQTITESGTVTAGTFRLLYRNDRTTPLQWNASAADILAALRALNEIGAAGLSGATGGPIQTTPVVVTFAANMGLRDVQQLTVENIDLVGGTYVVTTNVAGVTGSARGLGKGAVVMAEDTGELYLNTGTDTAPTWKLITHAA